MKFIFKFMQAKILSLTIKFSKLFVKRFVIFENFLLLSSILRIKSKLERLKKYSWNKNEVIFYKLFK